MINKVGVFTAIKHTNPWLQWFSLHLNYSAFLWSYKLEGILSSKKDVLWGEMKLLIVFFSLETTQGWRLLFSWYILMGKNYPGKSSWTCSVSAGVSCLSFSYYTKQFISTFLLSSPVADAGCCCVPANQVLASTPGMMTTPVHMVQDNGSGPGWCWLLWLPPSETPKMFYRAAPQPQQICFLLVHIPSIQNVRNSDVELQTSD